jgi:hydrogenase expression/formation protein HypC
VCLAVPVKVIAIDGSEADIEIGGVKRHISIVLTPEAKVGDYVLLHTGYSINIIDENEARETMKLFEEILNCEESDHKLG